MAEKITNTNPPTNDDNDYGTTVNELFSALHVQAYSPTPKNGSSDGPVARDPSPSPQASNIQPQPSQSQMDIEGAKLVARAAAPSVSTAAGVTLLIAEMPKSIKKWLEEIPKLSEMTSAEVISEISRIVKENVGNVPNKETVRYLKELIHLQSKTIEKMAAESEKHRADRDKQIDHLIDTFVQLETEVELHGKLRAEIQKINEEKAQPFHPQHGNSGCHYCKSTHHNGLRCFQYPTVESRRRLLTMENRCFSCFNVGHGEDDCPSKRTPCTGCKKAHHHRSLCIKRTPDDKIAEWHKEEKEKQEKKWIEFQQEKEAEKKMKEAEKKMKVAEEKMKEAVEKMKKEDEMQKEKQLEDEEMEEWDPIEDDKEVNEAMDLG